MTQVCVRDNTGYVFLPGIKTERLNSCRLSPERFVSCTDVRCLKSEILYMAWNPCQKSLVYAGPCFLPVTYFFAATWFSSAIYSTRRCVIRAKNQMFTRATYFRRSHSFRRPHSFGRPNSDLFLFLSLIGFLMYN